MKPFFALLAALALASAAPAQQPKVIIFPLEAIADSAVLTKEQFQERYPGIDITDFGLMDEGWYVRYNHELLTYVYGPIADLDEARRQKKVLEEIRLNLVLKNPKLSTSKVDIIEFRFSGGSQAPAVGEKNAEATASQE